MKGTTALALFLVTLAGCARPIAAFSPRRTGTPAHRKLFERAVTEITRELDERRARTP